MLNPNPSPWQPSPIASPFAPLPIQVEKQPEQPLPKEADLPRFVNFLADYSGCGHWRIIWPEYVINMTGVGMSQSTTAMVADPRWYQNVKCVKVQRQASNSQKEFIKHLKKIQQEAGFKIIYEVDDVVFKEEIPDYNKFKFAFDTEEVRNNCIEIINMVDEVTVTCDFMRRLYQEKTGKQEITVIPNFMPNFWMGNIFNKKKVQRDFTKNKQRPRILYTGSGAHYDVDNKVGGKDDMYGVRDIIRKTVNKYQWVFVGAFPPQLVDLVQSGKIEFHPWRDLLSYPAFISSLNVQLMVAPLQVNNFNNAKSDIKFLEACTLGIPCLCQDMETYNTAPSYLKFSTPEEFEHKIRTILHSKNRARYFGNIDKLRSIAEKRILELPQNIGSHLEALTTPHGSSERKYLREWN